jgi:hypothetical protein
MKLKIIFLMVSLVINNIECKSRSKDIVGEICKFIQLTYCNLCEDLINYKSYLRQMASNERITY